MPITKISNYSEWPGNPPSTICIKEGDPGWGDALEKYLSGQDPTDSPEWKKGVIATVMPASWARGK